MQYAAHILGVVNNVFKASSFVIVHVPNCRIFQSIGTIMQLPLFSDIAYYKKEMHYYQIQQAR